MIRPRGSFAVLVVSVAIFQAIVLGGELQGATIEDIRSAFSERRHLLRDLDVTVEVRPGVDPQSRSFSVHRFLAVGSIRLSDNAHYYNDVPVEFDTNHHIVYYDGERLDVYYVTHRLLERTRARANGPASWKVRMPLVYEFLAWWPPADKSADLDRTRREIVDLEWAAEDAIIGEKVESVDGHECVVVQCRGQILWCDPEIGFALRKRVFTERDGSEVTYFLDDYRKIDVGIWFPHHGVRVIRAVNGAPMAAPHSTDMRVISVRANDGVRRADLAIDLAAGTVLDDRDTAQVAQVVPGGREVLDCLPALVDANNRAVLADTGHVSVWRIDEAANDEGWLHAKTMLLSCVGFVLVAVFLVKVSPIGGG